MIDDSTVAAAKTMAWLRVRDMARTLADPGPAIVDVLVDVLVGPSP